MASQRLRPSKQPSKCFTDDCFASALIIGRHMIVQADLTGQELAYQFVDFTESSCLLAVSCTCYTRLVNGKYVGA